MATANTHDLCRLCLCRKLIKLESMQQNEILKRIKQSSIALCGKCYKALEDFHQFYESVHSAQKNFTFLQNELTVSHRLKSTSTQTNSYESEWTEEEARGDLCIGEACDEQSEANEEQKSKLESEEEEDGKDVLSNTDESNGADFRLETEKSNVKKGKLAKPKEISSDIEKKMMEFYNIKCEKCEDVKFTSFKMLSRHYSSVHNMQGYIKCCKRNIRVNDKSYLRSHMLKHLEPDTCRCKICGKQLSSTVTLKHHMILHRPTEERPFHCTQCDKRFCCKNDLKNHEKAVHVPESEREDFICDVCGKVFQKVANLRYHHSTVHLQERKYVCELCAKSFTTQSGLRTHMNAAHSTRGPIQCQECNKWLKNEDTFQKHLQLHQNNSYPCSKCNKVCNSSTSLRSHMVKHSDDRPHSCSICRKSFKTKTHLKNHSVQHSGGSNYKCPFCSKSFVNMSNYYTHRKRMHFNDDGAKQSEKVSVLKSEEMYRDDENHGSNFVYDYKLIREDSVIALSASEVPVVRQNIIVSPTSVKYS